MAMRAHTPHIIKGTFIQTAEFAHEYQSSHMYYPNHRSHREPLRTVNLIRIP
jgi:hypothetical protein